MILLTELKLQNDRVEHAIDTMTDILLLLRTEPDTARRELLWEIYQRARQHMNTESARLKDLLDRFEVQHKEKQMQNRLVSAVTVILLLALLLVGMTARAQDVPLATNTVEVIETLAATEPAATAEPTVVPSPVPTPVVEPPAPTPTPEPGFNLREFLIGALAGVATSLAAVFGIIGRLKNDKPALDAIEWLGRSIPVEALDKLNELGRNLRDAGEVLDKVSDKLPNTVEPTGGLG